MSTGSNESETDSGGTDASRAPEDFRAELLSILNGTEPERLPTCHSYECVCGCPRCTARAKKRLKKAA